MDNHNRTLEKNQVVVFAQRLNTQEGVNNLFAQILSLYFFFSLAVRWTVWRDRYSLADRLRSQYLRSAWRSKWNLRQYRCRLPVLTLAFSN